MEDYLSIDPDKALVQISSLWRIKLPDDRYKDCVLAPTNQIGIIYVTHQKFTKRDEAMKVVVEINEWARKLGGRPRIKKKVEDYIDVDMKIDKRTLPKRKTG